MLLEQAFFHLSEILHGSGYQQQEYEGGIVGAFSLALLQALNGRNVTKYGPTLSFQNSKSILFKGLTAGITYTLQLCAIGGSTGAGDWSDPVTRMAMQLENAPNRRSEWIGGFTHNSSPESVRGCFVVSRLAANERL